MIEVNLWRMLGTTTGEAMYKNTASNDTGDDQANGGTGSEQKADYQDVDKDKDR